jgi:hypothetical protein
MKRSSKSTKLMKLLKASPDAKASLYIRAYIERIVNIEDILDRRISTDESFDIENRTGIIILDPRQDKETLAEVANYIKGLTNAFNKFSEATSYLHHNWEMQVSHEWMKYLTSIGWKEICYPEHCA